MSRLAVLAAAVLPFTACSPLTFSTAVKGESVLLAAEVKKGDATLVLRDVNGVPKWGGGGRQRSRRPPSGG